MNALAKTLQRPLDLLDRLLDGLTSYKLLLYYLLVLAGWAVVISLNKSLPFSWHAILLSAVVLILICRSMGELFSRVLNISRNWESDYITALILALIMSPASTGKGFAVLAGAGFAAIASKYLLVISRRHIFNPAALGAVVAGLAFHQYASWWVGTAALAPLVFVGGILILRKMKRFIMVSIFMLLYFAILIMNTDGISPLHAVWLGLTGTAVMFFAYVMLIEPLTSPDKMVNYILYVLVVGVFYSVTRFHVSPEEALLIGNVAAYALERGKRLELKLERVHQEADGLFTYAFSHMGVFDYKAGQFMEWTLPLHKSDTRGNRRYLTLSSSPSENLLAVSVRMPEKPSQFKQKLAKFKPGDKILASHLGGSFTLPRDKEQKLTFVAGGIGVTPFRSIVKFLSDKRQERDVNLIYCAAKPSEFAFQEVFTQAKNVGVVTHYIDTSVAPISVAIISKAVPEYGDQLFYISGPYGFVKAVRQALLDLGVRPNRIKSDYFPGYG